MAILSGNDPVAFACVFGIARAGAVWCPVNPRNEAAENRELLELFDCTALLYQAAFAPLVAKIRDRLPLLTTLVCLDRDRRRTRRCRSGSTGVDPTPMDDVEPPDDVVDARRHRRHDRAGPRGCVLTGRNLETMSALTLMSYPFQGRPIYLALAPLTHAAGVLCFPVHGARRRDRRDAGARPRRVPRAVAAAPGHAHVPAADADLHAARRTRRSTRRTCRRLQCLWYGAAPMSADRLEEALTRIGPVMGQLFGQSEAPMMVSTLAPAEHFRADGRSPGSGFARPGGRPRW